MRPHERCIATSCLSGSLPEKLEAAALCGYDAVELFESDLLNYPGSPADVRDIALELGLRIAIFQPFRDFEAMPDTVRLQNLDRAERKFDLMQALGTDLLLVCSNVLDAAIGDDARAAADLAELARRAAGRSLRVGYEALAWGRHVNRWAHAWSLVQRADHPALGLVVDSFQTLAIGDDPSGISRIPADKLFFVQLADAPVLARDVTAMDVRVWSRHHRVFPGQGELDVARFVRAVLASAYRGPLSLDVFNDHFRAAPARAIARDGLRALTLVMAEAGGPPLPPVPRLNGVEFLEFAVEPNVAGRMAAYFLSLGFRRTAQHRSKQVELWQSGGVRLVLNTEPDSAAAEYAMLHGPSCCAIALRVDDAERAISRAEALGCPESREPIGMGERTIPAVRAPDGTLVYLVAPGPQSRTIWDDDFTATSDPVDLDGFTGVDHVALAMGPGQMEPFVLFYRAVFGMVAQPMLELPDPYGLVRSRALVDPDETVRVPLNISHSVETGTGRFVTVMAGAGVHHVALSVRDLAFSLTRLGAAGLSSLPIPANYYDDLGARFALPEKRLAELQVLNILYDRDETGAEYLHAYSRSFDERFFFELVQRGVGYAGFGAANATVRLAAQAAARPRQATMLPL